MRFPCRLATALLFLPATVLQAGEWRGYVAGEWLGFLEDPAYADQHRSYLSVATEPEYFHEWHDGSDLFTFEPYALLDQYDSNRTHADIRELSWDHAAYDWELRAGISKVFWGVTESVHLVDIINQTDLVVNLDGEDKLGQPMLKLSLIRDWGVVDLFLLPAFRERTFPGKAGRVLPSRLMSITSATNLPQSSGIPMRPYAGLTLSVSSISALHTSMGPVANPAIWSKRMPSIRQPGTLTTSRRIMKSSTRPASTCRPSMAAGCGNWKPLPAAARVTASTRLRVASSTRS
jgi:hypothetical protein